VVDIGTAIGGQMYDTDTDTDTVKVGSGYHYSLLSVMVTVTASCVQKYEQVPVRYLVQSVKDITGTRYSSVQWA
jgi:hypothetical protein